MTWSRIRKGSFSVPSQSSAIRFTCEERSAFCGRMGGGERVAKPKAARAAKRRNRVSNGKKGLLGTRAAFERPLSIPSGSLGRRKHFEVPTRRGQLSKRRQEREKHTQE